MTNVWNRAGNRFLDPDFPIELGDEFKQLSPFG